MDLADTSRMVTRGPQTRLMPPSLRKLAGGVHWYAGNGQVRSLTWKGNGERANERNYLDGLRHPFNVHMNARMDACDACRVCRVGATPRWWSSAPRTS